MTPPISDKKPENILYPNERNFLTGLCGPDLYWLYSDFGDLIIKGVGPMYDYDEFTYGRWTEPYGLRVDSFHPIINDVHDLTFPSLFEDPPLKNVVFKEGITYIGEGAFYAMLDREGTKFELDIPEGVVAIGAYAFANCEKLSRVSLPSSLRFLGDNVFMDCPNLEKVEYRGTLEQKKRLFIQTMERCTPLYDKAVMRQLFHDIEEDDFDFWSKSRNLLSASRF